MIVTIATRKGGSGKSTIATNLAALRKARKHDVSLVDTDDQQSSAMWAATRVLPREDGTPSNLEGVPILCTTGKGVGPAITAYAKKYEDLIIDVPGRDANELRTSILVSDVIALPLRPSNFDLWAFEKDLEMIEEAKITKDSVNMKFRAFIFFNGINTNPAVKAKEMKNINDFLSDYERKMEDAGIEVSPFYVSNRGAYNRAVQLGQSVHEITGGGISDDHARHEIEQLYKFIYGSNK